MVDYKDILRTARQIARQFKPQKIILFGSYAYGTPTEDSDVDLMVVMNYRGSEHAKAMEILRAVRPPFSVDLLVRKTRRNEPAVSRIRSPRARNS